MPLILCNAEPPGVGLWRRYKDHIDLAALHNHNSSTCRAVARTVKNVDLLQHTSRLGRPEKHALSCIVGFK